MLVGNVDEKIEHLIEKEIRELHRFFQRWFAGNIEKREINRLDNVIHENFILITPSASLLDKKILMQFIQESYGTKKDIRIWTDNINIHAEINNIYIVTYDEFQTLDEHKTIRRSSAVFRFNSDKINNLEWIKVHETWYPQ